MTVTLEQGHWDTVWATGLRMSGWRFVLTCRGGRYKETRYCTVPNFVVGMAVAKSLSILEN